MIKIQHIFMPKISVILPVLNGEKFIRNAIESVISQSFRDFELIVVNDGSTDNTLNILNSYDDERIIIVNQTNHGPGHARNTALERARGEYVMFLDADDYFKSNALETAYVEISKNNADISFFQIINYFEGKFYESPWFSLNNFDESFEKDTFKPEDTFDFLFDISGSPCQKIFKKSFLDEIDAKFPQNTYFEDMPFFFYTYLKAGKVSIIKKFLYVRCKQNDSITEKLGEKYLDTVKAGQILMDIFIKNNWYDIHKFDLLAFKINGPRYALKSIEEKYRKDLFNLIKSDYNEIKHSQYYEDYINNLGPVKKKFFLDVLKAKNYNGFLKMQV